MKSSSRIVISALVALAFAAAMLSLPSWRGGGPTTISATYQPPSRPTGAENATSDRAAGWSSSSSAAAAPARRHRADDRDRGRGRGRGGRALLFEGMVRLERTEYKLPIHVERNFLDWDDRGDADGGDGGDDNAAVVARRVLPVFWHVLKSGGTSVKLMYAQCYHLVEACETGALIDARDRGREGQRDGLSSKEEKEEEEEEEVRGNYPNPWEWMQQQLLQPQQQQQQAGRGDGENNERRRLKSMTRSSEGGERGGAPPPHEQRQQQQPQERQRGGESESPLRVVTSEDGRRYVNVDVTTVGGIREASELGFASSDLADVVFTPLVTEAAQFLFGHDDDGAGGGGGGGGCSLSSGIR